MLLFLSACAHPTPPAPAAPPEPPVAAPVAPPPPPAPPRDEVVDGLLAAARADHAAWKHLATLTDLYGPRPTGSPELAGAIEWALAQFRADGLENVRAEPVMVPVWERGNESLLMTAPRAQTLAVLGLGGSVGTKGIEAPVVVVRSFDELGPAVKGKIVLFNVPMADGVPTIERYGTAVAYRVQGASKAAEQGAVASLVRSVTTRSLYTPHTGAMRYTDGVTKIPSAAITAEDADHITRLVEGGAEVRLKLKMDARSLPDAPSANAIGEIRGETPEIVVLGCHIDSWDVGRGAHDDGAGCIQVMEAMRLLKATGRTPKRTIRGVLYTNEEFGLRGGIAYAAAHPDEPHAAAIESDLGGGKPRGWGASGSPEDLAWLGRALEPTGLGVVGEGGGADISTLEDRGVLQIGLLPDDSHYFDVHHTRADTVDKVDPDALAEGVGQMAALAWRLANTDR